MSIALAELGLLAMLSIGQTGDEATKKDEARKHLERGNALLLEGKADEALAAYDAAYASYPSPKILFNIGEAQFELGRFVGAAESYERVIRELDSASPLVSAAKEKLTAADGRVARISIATLPTGGAISVGGRDLGAAPLDRVRVDPGPVEVTATLGDRSESQTVDLEAGEERSIEVDLIPIALPPPPPPIVDEPITSKWWFWAAIGAGVVVAGTAIGVAVGTTGGDDFVPMGELGTTSLDEWSRR